MTGRGWVGGVGDGVGQVHDDNRWQRGRQVSISQYGTDTICKYLLKASGFLSHYHIPKLVVKVGLFSSRVAWGREANCYWEVWSSTSSSRAKVWRQVAENRKVCWVKTLKEDSLNLRQQPHMILPGFHELLQVFWPIRPSQVKLRIGKDKQKKLISNNSRYDLTHPRKSASMCKYIGQISFGKSTMKYAECLCLSGSWTVI